MKTIEFKQARLYSTGEVNPTRWREFPTPKRERDGYTIAQYEYDKGWCEPYYHVYFNSNHIDRCNKKYKTIYDAKEAANKHKNGQL